MYSAGECRECGARIPADSRSRFCAQCLLGLALGQIQNPEPGMPGAADRKVKAKEGRVQSARDQTPKVEIEKKKETRSTTQPPAPLTYTTGDRIGRYRLLQEIGYGGCGVVYLAEQDEPVRRKVALKVIKLGMDTKQVIARFEAERQALALMDHPNIAKVFDGGTIGDADAPVSSPNSQLFLGRPYFVMELVGGIRITDYCDQNNLSIRQRLDLFIQVCRAIQ